VPDALTGFKHFGSVDIVVKVLCHAVTYSPGIWLTKKP
jgi:hypothetical protein